MRSEDTKVARIKVAQVRAHATNVRKDLGDLRDLEESIQRFGIMQPITVEHRPDYWLLRDGHRRIAAATMLGIERVPAVIHREHLDDDEWLTHAVHHNHRRRQLDKDDRAHAVKRMREAGKTWEGIGHEFGVSAKAVQRWVNPQGPRERQARRRSVGLGTVARFAGSWKAAVDSGQVSAEDALAALVQASESGRFSDCQPPQASDEAA